MGLLVCFEAVKSASGQTPTQQQQTPAESQPQPQPAAVSPSPSQTAIEQPQASVETKESEKEPTAFWDAKLSDWIQVGINAVLLFIVFWQARTNSQQREIMEVQIEHTKITERAYLGLHTAITERYDIGAIPVVRVRLVNGGRTPAYEVKGGGILSIGERFPDELPEVTEKESQTFVASGGHINFNFPFHAPLTSQLVRIISSGEWKVYLHMTAHFTDVWGDKQIVILKLEFNPAGERWGSYKGPDEEQPIVTIGAPYRK